ncbi:RNA 2'-phosphotransferase [Longimicrobium sp.]|uniref:RNA 2'-phosphotransferase n=1 Tax=Longimicrobium sp. TaxID=2029185 RepID=UPI0032C2267E
MRKSKFLSRVLRHAPESIGLEMDEAGWVDVEALMRAARRAGVGLDRATLDRVVAENNKKRFAYSPDRKRIRASQGHSVKVELGLDPVEPPEVLFHGTADRNLDSIRAEGLRPGNRTHVHLSADEPTAVAVGRRHGRPVVLHVRAGAMHAAGHAFYRSDNGVWLADTVPAEFIDVPGA